MIKILEHDIIENIGTESIVESANGIGVDNRYYSSVIRELSGETMKKECIEAINKKEEGDFYITNSGNLEKYGIKYIFHAIICKYPNSFSSYDYIYKSMNSILKTAIDKKIKSIAFSDLGSFLGLDKESVARIMIQVATNFCQNIDIVFFSNDEHFLKLLKKYSF